MENEKIIQLAANKSAEEINIMYEHCKDQNDILIEAIRQNLSRILMDTNEDNKITCNIILEAEAMGLSDLEKTNIVSAWQEPTEGTIWFNIYGSNEEINLDDIALEDQVIIVNELNSNYGLDKIYFVKDRSETQRGLQLNDGRIISLYNKDNKFYLSYDSVLDLDKGVIIRKGGGLTLADKNNGYTTLNDIIRNKQAKEVNCYDCLDFNMDVYMDDPELDKKVTAKKIIKFFRDNGYNVTSEAVNWCFENWKSGFKSGYRDQENGYHLFNPCGGNALSIRLTTLNPLCEDWQVTYWC